MACGRPPGLDPALRAARGADDEPRRQEDVIGASRARFVLDAIDQQSRRGGALVVDVLRPEAFVCPGLPARSHGGSVHDADHVAAQGLDARPARGVDDRRPVGPHDVRLDRVTEPPSSEWLAEKRRYFLSESERLGMAAIDDGEFAYEFRLQTLQRCLKATGTFSFQSVNRGKTYFVPFINPMFEIVVRTVENLDRFPNLRRIVGEQIADPSA